MTTKTIFLIANNLGNFIPLLNQFPKQAPFAIEVLPFEEFCQSAVKRLKNHSPEEFIIVLENEFAKSVTGTLQKTIDLLFPKHKPLLVYIIKEPREREDEYKDFYTKEHLFFLSESFDPWHTTLYFISFCNQIFLESNLNYYLCDYMSTSVDEIIKSDTLNQLYTKIKELNVELERKNSIDPLTNLYNRRALFQFLTNELNRTKRRREILERKSQQVITQKNLLNLQREQVREMKYSVQKDICALAIILMDIDFFKKINDTYGHLIGDTVLSFIGKLLMKDKLLRSSDIPTRYGGEEFVIILPETCNQNARLIADRIQENISQETFHDEAQHPFQITISIGISEVYQTDTSAEDVIKRADRALYWAKEHGRNKTIIYEDLAFPLI